MARYARPEPAEYASYYARYVDLVPDGDILDILALQIQTTGALLLPISHEKARYRYAPGKWSVKQVVGHLADVEWVFTYRALRFARGDETELPGIEQDLLAAGSNHDRRSLPDILEEHRLLRTASLRLFSSFDEEIQARSGIASGYRFTVRAIPFIIAGHERHHVRVLKERYLA